MSNTSSEDEEYRELMLKKLHAYADEFLGYTEKSTNKSKCLKNEVSRIVVINDDEKKEIDTSVSKRKRRKQKKFKNKLTEKKSHLSKICEVVGIEDITKLDDSPALRVTGSDLRHLEQLNEGASVKVFLDPDDERRKRREMKIAKRNLEISSTEVIKDNDRDEFDLKKASLDVRRCGIKAMDVTMKEHATISMLKDLGAKAPKRNYTNYKLLQVNLKEKNAQIARDKEQENLLGIKKNKKQKTKRKRNEINYLDGQIGVYRRGVQMIGNKAIKKSLKK